MLKISDVSKVTGIPVKTIRFWEEMRLIAPAMVDEYTGYRRYDEKNIERLSQIVYLKELGFSLKEIALLNDEVIHEKTKSLQEQLEKLRNSILELSSLGKNKKGEYIMKNFVNDENAIGHWKLLGLAKTQEAADSGALYHEDDFHIEDLYLMENGKQYWVVSWTKGYIIVCDRRYPYTIDGNKMVVAMTYDDEVEHYAVYEKIDGKKHQVTDIILKDTIDLPFENDPTVIGFWESVDFIQDKTTFTPEKRQWKGNLWLKKIALAPNGEATFTADGEQESIVSQRWTKGVILNIYQNHAMHYDIVEIGGETYLIMEWKSGDYTYAGQINFYYVFRKIK